MSRLIRRPLLSLPGGPLLGATLLLVGAAPGGFACSPGNADAGPPVAPTPTVQPAAAAPAPGAAPVSGLAAAGQPPAPGQGLGCADDRHCPGYLRCQAGACADPPALDGVGGAPGPRVIFDLPDGRTAAFRLELAIRPFEQERGLMFRPRQHPGWGMVFLYPQDSIHRFWMRNTLIPLDMLFLSAQGEVVCVVAQAEPLSDDSRVCPQPARHVLELVGGTAARLGLRPGTPYRLVDLPQQAAGFATGGKQP